MTYVEFNLIRMISAGIITAAISAAYCSFAYLLHGPLLKITMFQCKIIHNILATKLSLFRAKNSDNDVCPQCLADAHSLDHMFFHCSSVIAFWKTFQNWLANKTKQQLKLSNSIILNDKTCL